MKRTVLTFGVISGAISSVLMLATMPFVYKIGFDKAMYVGYSAIILALLLIYFGIRSYRDNVSNGEISFGRAFVIGILITLISTVFYVVTWEIIYYNFLPDFADKYTAYLSEKMRNSGASAEQIAQQVDQFKNMKTILENPLYNALIAFTEPLPVGLLITLISAVILRRKRKTLSEEQPA